MKSFCKYLLLAVPFFSLNSCKKFLETPQKSQLSLSQFWKSQNDAELGVAAIYNAAQIAFEVNYWRWGELRADNFINNDRPNADNSQLVNNQLTTASSGADWSDLYTAILTANTAIKKIPDIPDFAGKAQLLGEAYTLRALFYFYAVRIWGAVPKITEPIEGLDQDLNFIRTPADEIYDDIIFPDLEKAENLLTTERSINTISKGAMLALKAEIYMWPGKHQDFNAAINVISELETFGYGLESTETAWINIFKGPESSKEIIFSLAWNFNEDGGNSGIGIFSTATPEFVPSEALEQKWNDRIPGDFRTLATAAFDVEIVPGVEFPYLRVLTKYSARFIQRNDQGTWASTNDRDIIFYRLSGLLLLKAEAENYLDHPSKALSIVNKIRTARGLPPVDSLQTDKTGIRNLILDERQFELMGEGHRFWDLVRNGVVLTVMGPVNGMSDPKKIYWPLSQNVLNRNSKLEQNVGY